jgi:uncharacterized protein involved in exopolysaccharide biosynthesis
MTNPQEQEQQFSDAMRNRQLQVQLRILQANYDRTLEENRDLRTRLKNAEKQADILKAMIQGK